MLALAGVSFGDPAHWIAYTAAFSVALGVAGATQDITIDGWHITSVPVAKQSVMTAISEMGSRVVRGRGRHALEHAVMLNERVEQRCCDMEQDDRK